MRQIAAFLILAALFLLVVGSRFKPTDGDKLNAVARLALGKVKAVMPPAEKVAAPVHAIRGALPQGVEERVKSRLEGDRQLAGVEFGVSADGPAVKLRGVVPTAAARQRAVELAETTVGVEKVTDELAVPVE